MKRQHPLNANGECSTCGGRVRIRQWKGKDYCGGRLLGTAGKGRTAFPASLPELSEVEWSGFAKFFDGEGSIFAMPMQLVISVSSTHEVAAREFLKLGGNVYRKTSRGSHAAQFMWRTGKTLQAKAILQHFIPYLTIKRTEAALALTWPERQKGMRFTDDVKAERQRIRLELKALKNAYKQYDE